MGHYELLDVRTFLAVVESGSFSRAAVLLHTTKSVISQRIGRLERALGVELLQRSHLGASLTTKGSAYWEQVVESVALLDSAAESVVDDARSLTGSLRVSLPMTFGVRYLCPVLCEFLQLYPHLEMEAELHDHQVDLVAEGYDLGIRITCMERPSELTVRLAESKRVVCCSPTYIERNGRPETLVQLAEHRGIGYSNRSPDQLWRFQGRDCPTPPSDGRIRLNNGEAIRDAALEGLGICLLPLFIVADDLKAGRLVQLLSGERPLSDEIYAICPARRFRLRRVRVLLDYLQLALGGVPPWERGSPFANEAFAVS